MKKFSNKMQLTFAALTAITMFLPSAPAFAQYGTAPDNTAVNQRDRDPSSVTADQAPNNPQDLNTMQQIRKSVMQDAALSSYAHNIKIVAQGGKVTLKGPVRSQQESNEIQAKATQIAGDGNVINQLTVSQSANQ